MDLKDLQSAIVARRAERGFVTDPVKLCVLLTEEVGELAQLIKRTWSPNYEPPSDQDFAEECSDVLIILTAIAHEFGVDLETAVTGKFFEKDEMRRWATAQNNRKETPMSSVDKAALLNSLPAEWPEDLLPQIQKMVASGGRKVVVLDDDPTGTQTIHDLAVLTRWSVTDLEHELTSQAPAFYILTNSRALTGDDAAALNAEIGRNLHAASLTTGVDFTVVSRSDSTLRGHYPGEVDALAEALGEATAPQLIIPFFLEGGRYTIDDIHYVAEGDQLVPAGETQFARDAAFGYRSSNMAQWVEEKTGGRVAADDVVTVSLVDIRKGGPERVTEKLVKLGQGSVCAVNAASYRDLEVFVMGLLTAEAQGKRFVYRTAASFVRVLAGIAPQPLLALEELGVVSEAGALFVVGSYVPKSTSQLSILLEQPNVAPIEVSVGRLLEKTERSGEIARAASAASAAIAAGRNAVVYTSRELVTGENAEQSLAIGNIVSDGLVQIVQSITAQPRYLVAKGGITSSDVAVHGLGVVRAMVLGQILPGIPVWRLGEESRFPGMGYVVFPGNVGDEDGLALLAI